MKRTAERTDLIALGGPFSSVVRFTDLVHKLAFPSSELLVYYRSSAIADWAHKLFGQSPLSGKSRGSEMFIYS